MQSAGLYLRIPLTKSEPSFNLLPIMIATITGAETNRKMSIKKGRKLMDSSCGLKIEVIKPEKIGKATVDATTNLKENSSFASKRLTKKGATIAIGQSVAQKVP